MKQECTFTEINLATWSRRELFFYFSQMAPTGYSLTTEVDVTHFRKILQANGKKFFSAYLWLVTKTLCQQEAFRCASKDGKLGTYNTLTPLYASFHEDDKTFSLMWTEYDDDYSAFHDAYLHNQQTYGQVHGVLAQKEPLPPPNAYTISCIPWVNFQHFAVHSYENKPYYFPSVEAGKFVEKEGKCVMPLSLTCHHATTDGYHIHLFLEALQNDMNTFERFL